LAQLEMVAAARMPAKSVGNTKSGDAEEPQVRTTTVRRLWLSVAAVVVVMLAGGLLAKSFWPSSGTPNEPLTQSSLHVNDQDDPSASSGRNSTRAPRSNRQKSAAEKNDPFVVNINQPEVLAGNGSQSSAHPHDNNTQNAPVVAQVDIPGQDSAQEQTTTASGQLPGTSENRIVHSEPPLQDEVKQDSTPPKKDPFVVPGVSGVAGSGQQGESGPGTNPAKGTQSSSPLAGLLPSVALANSESQSTHVLGTLAAESLSSLRVDFLSDPETVGRGKLYFSLSTDTSRDHAWRLEMQRQSTDQALEPIADLCWRDGQLEFTWRPDLDAKSPANYFVNGLFRFRHGDQERLVRLREPLVIPPLALSGEALSSRSIFDIEWLPQGFQIELGALTVENGWERVHVEPIEWTPRQPLMLRFRTNPEEQLFWLVGQVDTRNRIGFSLDTMSALSQRPIKRKDLDQTVEMLNQRYQFLVEAEARAKLEADNAPYGQKTKARERATEARALANEGRRAREIASEAREAILQIVDRELPLRIVYTFGDYHIELARSSNFAEPKKK
ncbi:MAG TPA: hypothetical protein PKD54_12330, partial [Pirellulaceae bacterium]|nr:hypothetical protein [Pirellulaceae bacterium]